MTVDFSRVPDHRQHPTGNFQDDDLPRHPISAEGKSLNAKQIRARLRRKAKRHKFLTTQEIEHLYNKPVEDWDLDELAAGRPKNAQGHFKGPKPQWINAAVHEEAMQKYTAAVKSSMRGTTVDALSLLKELINNNDVDDKGKPLVGASVKLDAAKFLIEHVVGKPTQVIQNDVSIKLQAILGQVMVNPGQVIQDSKGSLERTYTLGHYPGHTMELSDGLDNDDDYFADQDTLG